MGISKISLVEKMTKQVIGKYINNLAIHGAITSCYDSTLIAKNSKKVGGIQQWDAHSNNASIGGYINGHHFGILGLIGRFNNFFICFIVSLKLKTGKKSSYQWKVSPSGDIERLKIWDVAHAQLLQLNEWYKEYDKPIRVVLDVYFSNKPFIIYLGIGYI